MNQSERIEIITKIADNLSEKEYPLIDLTLRQFNLPTSDIWQYGDQRLYVMSMIEEADDHTLIQLSRHLGLTQPNISSGIQVSISKVSELIKEIELQKGLMNAVATGGPRINDVKHEYTDRRRSIESTLTELGIDNPNPYPDLWAWYGRWSDGSLPSYQSRRNYIGSLYQPLLDSLQTYTQRTNIEQVEPTGWERVDRTIGKIVDALELAVNEEDFQGVGLLCREAVISLAQAVYNPEIHPSVDGVDPSETDAKRMLENYISAELSGSSNEQLRRFAKDSYNLAVLLQHKRNASFREAALCVEATRSITNVIAIASGQRNP